ncbi:hypothetical protein CC80DRAFT_443757 [Byssothecium circinans]|uniref:Macro domain-containing protein n=1 Tax=Byssothecium circinans TaxID=147558 RepID=A0A6A5U3D0_9PLEO|nr:hypothetical protein CC80DRAFT_443757 [Byssothecium circinans]
MSAIRIATAANVRAFLNLTTAITTGDSDHALDYEALQDEIGRFRVWCGNIGALQKGHSSLDYRLRDSPLLSSNTLKLLAELKENLEAALDIVSGNRLPYEKQQKPDETDEDEVENDDFFSEDEDEDEPGAPKTELEMRFREFVDIIDNLYKLSVRIRQPTIRSRSLKAASYAPKDPETQIDILEQYAAFDLQHTWELVRHLRTPYAGANDIEKDEALIHRLARAVTLRRRQFKYWKRHRDKLGVSTIPEDAPIQPQVERPEQMNLHDTLEVQPGVTEQVIIKEAPSQKTGKTMLSGTEVTYHHQSLDDIVDSKSVTSYATTVRDASGRSIQLPPPPKAADGEKDFECPICYIICPSRYANQRSWKTHVLQDLQPYVCTYLDCDMPDQLFTSRRQWTEHEASHRKVWRCPEHSEAIFTSAAGLRDHFRREHSDSFPESQLDSIVKVGETTTVDLRTCPICHAPSDIHKIGNHIANHLERIAAFALPTSSHNDSDGASSQASRGSTDRTGSQNLSGVSFISDFDDDIHEDLQRSVIKNTTSLEATEGLPADLARSHQSNAEHNLSAELLSEVPNATQERLEMLFAQPPVTASAITGPASEDIVSEDKYDPAAVDSFVVYLRSLPNAGAVTCYAEANGRWVGNVSFKEEASVLNAINIFDRTRYPDVDLIRDEEYGTKLNFSFRQPRKTNRASSSPSDPVSEDEGANSDTSSTIFYGSRGREADHLWPIYTAFALPTLRSLYKTGHLLRQDATYAPKSAYNDCIAFYNHDITRLDVDAIVNSANRSLEVSQPDFTLNNIIHKAAGPDMRRECRAHPKIGTGQAIVTAGYKLPCRWVIHTARPNYSRSQATHQFKMLAECYRSALKLALERSFRTVAFPSLGSGGCGFPTWEAARIALRETRGFLDAHPSHLFHKIVFCVFSSVDEEAYRNLLPIYFPPVDGDLESAAADESGTNNAALSKQVSDTSNQLGKVAAELAEFRRHAAAFPGKVIEYLNGTKRILGSLGIMLLSPRAILDKQAVEHLNLLCTVMQAVTGSIAEITDVAEGKAALGQQSNQAIWDKYNSYMRTSQGIHVEGLLSLCQEFAQSLENVIVRNFDVPHEMTTISVRLGSWLVKTTGRGEQGVRDHFEEVMYTREFQRDTPAPGRTEVVKLHQIPSVSRLYQLRELEQKPTNSIPSTRFNHIVCLLRNDITQVEVDVIVNSTDIGFSGMGWLDHTVFRKAGLGMQEEFTAFGMCNEGDVKLTGAYQLPAKHVLHAVPPDTYRKTSKDVLRQIYREILQKAVSLKATSIAIPSIGTGMLNYPRRDCASLAMEEVKRFLESMDSSSPIEKIVFCVFGSSDELTYKSVLPVYFPPVDNNVNKALPADLFGSVGEAFRSGKQPANLAKRPLSQEEEVALEIFESHAQSCTTCASVNGVYTEGGSLCENGYTAAQRVLQLLHMDADQTVFSVPQGVEARRDRVEVPNVYLLGLELLSTVEMSSRAEGSKTPFVSPDLPWRGLAEHQKDTPLLGMIRPSMTLPEEPEKALAYVCTWSDILEEWRALQRHEASLHIYPGKLFAFVNERQTETQNPLLALGLTPEVSIEERIGTELVIDEAETLDESAFRPDGKVLLRCRSQITRDILIERLRHSAKSSAMGSTQDDPATLSSKSGVSHWLNLPSAPTSDPQQGDISASKQSKPGEDDKQSHPPSSTEDTLTVPNDMWICGVCHQGTDLTDMRCSVCGHARNATDFGPGQQYPENARDDISNLASQVLSYLRNPSNRDGVHEKTLMERFHVSIAAMTSVITELQKGYLIRRVTGSDGIWRATATSNLDPATRVLDVMRGLPWETNGIHEDILAQGLALAPESLKTALSVLEVSGSVRRIEGSKGRWVLAPGRDDVAGTMAPPKESISELESMILTNLISLTPQSVTSSTPAASTMAFGPRRPSMSSAMAQAQSASLARSYVGQFAPSVRTGLEAHHLPQEHALREHALAVALGVETSTVIGALMKLQTLGLVHQVEGRYKYGLWVATEEAWKLVGKESVPDTQLPPSTSELDNLRTTLSSVDLAQAPTPTRPRANTPTSRPSSPFEAVINLDEINVDDYFTYRDILGQSAGYTMIDRRLVSPEAVAEITENYEERGKDTVFVKHQQLTSKEVRRLAERTAEIRRRDKKGKDKVNEAKVNEAQEDAYFSQPGTDTKVPPPPPPAPRVKELSESEAQQQQKDAHERALRAQWLRMFGGEVDDEATLSEPMTKVVTDLFDGQLDYEDP